MKKIVIILAAICSAAFLILLTLKGIKEIEYFTAVDKSLTALHRAILDDDVNLVNNLISKGHNINELAAIHGRGGVGTPLSYACLKGNIQIAKILIDKGADINKSCPLAYAIMSGNFELVKLLIDKGAKINKTRNYNVPVPVLAAVDSNNPNILKYLVDKGADIKAGEGYFSPLHRAARMGFKDIVEYLISKGVKIDSGDITALQEASISGHLAVVKLLVSKGADVNRIDTDGRTPLSCAVLRAEPQMVDLLVRSGSDVNIKVKTGAGEGVGTCLLIAVYRYDNHPIEYKKIIESLLQNGADPNIKDNFGQTALDVAKSRNNQELIDLFNRPTKKN